MNTFVKITIPRKGRVAQEDLNTHWKYMEQAFYNNIGCS